jgi:hypothetical protein
VPDDFNITIVSDGARVVGQSPPRLTKLNAAIRDALTKDETIKVPIPRAMTPTAAQKEIVSTYMRRWAKDRGWRIVVRTLTDEDALLFWREPK